eukprot:365870-Chlamydomonas_euryale.AAC.5
MAYSTAVAATKRDAWWCCHHMGRHTLWLDCLSLLEPGLSTSVQFDMSRLKKEPLIREKFKLDREPGEVTPVGDFYARMYAIVRPRDDKDWQGKKMLVAHITHLAGADWLDCLRNVCSLPELPVPDVTELCGPRGHAAVMRKYLRLVQHSWTVPSELSNLDMSNPARPVQAPRRSPLLTGCAVVCRAAHG